MKHTTIKESKKLLSLGLDPGTADMHYREWKRMTDSIRIAHEGSGGKDDLPCWSSDALFQLIPSDNENEIITRHWGDMYELRFRDCVTAWHVSFFDAVYELVDKLLYKGYIKTK